MKSITLIRPDDWHLHVRDGDVLKNIIPHTAARFGRAIIMPNLKPPVTTTTQAISYQQRIQAAVPEGINFTPLMTLYLTDNMQAKEIAAAKDSGLVHAVKYYPAGATTNSDAGVTDLKKTYAALESLQQHGMPLLIHGEVTNPEIDVFDREAVFINTVLQPLLKDFPELKVVLEHITTAQAVDFIQSTSKNIAATITPQHLLFNRNDIFKGGIRPHYYCLPILKREQHREALVKAATSSNPKFFLGTDSAPHSQAAKQSPCGCAGIYSAHAAIELYAEAFEQNNALDKLEGFASIYGAEYYQLPLNPDKITLIKEPWQIPQHYQFGNDTLIPLKAGEMMQWKLT
ncbi:Dihydroorotase [hydrothermal vent metagenome]|uniref:dihydroorotase n=1 Tax=hydrothermal vent metagenome TaxID=652676 RepID=A0A3B1A8F6_9ZZZZ